jgi:secondary thiamine-phosphate synthase enzyme
MRIHHARLQVETQAGAHLHDITPQVRAVLAEAGIRNGVAVVTCRHTTTAITLNEAESRLLEDARRFFERLAPAADRYYHNDIELRDCPPDEPRNAHAHLLAMLLGSSETIPVVDGALDLGRWQSVLLVELDGPRSRTVSLQLMGE